jgi:transposase
MTLTTEQFDRIKGYLPIQRGNVKTENLTFIRALLYVAENGCKWRALPPEYGNWNSVYKKVNRWAKAGVLERVFAALQKERIITISIKVLALDSTSIKVHPDAHGALKKTGNKPSGSQRAAGTPSFMWYLRMIRLSSRCTCRAGSATTTPRGGNP